MPSYAEPIACSLGHRSAFAHVANKPFQLDAAFDDTETHITNVAANVHDTELFHAYPVVDLPVEHPELSAVDQPRRELKVRGVLAAPALAQREEAADVQRLRIPPQL